jgi:diguanylate cyclase (GGDEF)-like protein
MYSEFTQQLDIHELESLKDTFEYAAANHVRWIAKVNQALVCQQDVPETLCMHDNPHSHCALTQWFNSISKTSVQDDPSIQKIKSLHEALHLKACELISKMQTEKVVTADEYVEFSEIEYNYFKVQTSIIHECNEALGIVDSLTGLPNKRAFHDILNQEENRIKRNKFTSIISIVDIDDFRKVNEQHGYIAGDMLLIQLAALFKNSLRNFDTVARYAGDKFILYLPETDLISAEVILERFRQSIENTNFEIEADTITKVTCTFGVSFLDSSITADEGMANTWSSLHDAIANGRNSVGIDTSDEETDDD